MLPAKDMRNPLDHFILLEVLYHIGLSSLLMPVLFLYHCFVVENALLNGFGDGF